MINGLSERDTRSELATAANYKPVKSYNMDDYNFNPFVEVHINSEIFDEWLKDYGAPENHSKEERNELYREFQRDWKQGYNTI